MNTSKLGKAAGLLTALLLSTAGLTVISAAPASADTPASVSVRLTSPVFTDVNSVNRQSDADFFMANYGYGAGLSYHLQYALTGAAFELTYHVADATDETKAVAGATVKLAVNKAWSGSNAAMKSGDTVIGATNGGSDSAVLEAVTDADGNATFSLENTDTSSEEPNPATLSTEVSNSAPKLYSQMMATVNGQAADAADLIEFHFVNNLPTTSVSMRLQGIDSTNSYDGTHYATEQDWAQYYNAGMKWLKVQDALQSDRTLRYLVVDQDGRKLVNQEVQLRVAKDYSGSNAHIVVSDGVSFLEATSQQVTISSHTNLDGVVTFTVGGLGGQEPGQAFGPTCEAPDTRYTQIAPLYIGSVVEMDQAYDILNINFVAGTPISCDTSISAMTVNGTGVSTVGTPKFHVPFGTTSVEVVATTTDAHASVAVDGNTGLVLGDNEVNVNVTAEDGKTVRTYTLGVVVDAAPVSVKVAISAAMGKVNVKVTNAKGKTVRVYIKGMKAVTKKVTSDSQSFSFMAKKGKKTVSVSVAGKNYMKSVTVK